MGKLRERQSKFLSAVARLVLYAESIGYELTVGDAYRDPRVFGAVGVSRGYGHSRSRHKLRLAIDLNLFVDGDYIANGDKHHKLHDFWDLLGGNPRIESDLNHYSFSERDMR